MSDTAKAVASVLDTITGQIASLPDATIRAFVPVLQAAEKELARDLANYLRRVGADEKFTAQQMRNALLQIRQSLATIEKIGPELRRRLISGGQATASVAAGHLASEVALFGEIFGHSIRPVALEVSAMIARGNKMLIPRFTNSAARYAGAVGADIRQQLAIGLVRGETVDQMTKRLIKLGGPKGLVALRGKLGDPGAVSEYIAEGLFKRYGHWAERIVRTEVIQAYNTHAEIGIKDLAKEDPGMRSRWDATNDYRVCLICRGLHGATVPVGRPFSGGYSHPPAHPNCRCALVAWHVEWPEHFAAPAGFEVGATIRIPNPPRRKLA